MAYLCVLSQKEGGFGHVIGDRSIETVRKLCQLLKPLPIDTFCTDDYAIIHFKPPPKILNTILLHLQTVVFILVDKGRIEHFGYQTHAFGCEMRIV